MNLFDDLNKSNQAINSYLKILGFNLLGKYNG